MATLRGINDYLTALAFQPRGAKIIALGEIAVSFNEPYSVGLARFLLEEPFRSRARLF